MSLKRLLNPSTEHPPDAHYDHQPQFGWHNYGDPIDAEPNLQEQSWPSYVDELLGRDTIADELNHNDGDTTVSGAMCFAQEQMEQWAANSMNLQEIPATPRLETEDEQICYGMIYRASVKLRGDMAELDRKLSTGGPGPFEGFYQMNVLKSDEDFLVTFPDGTVMGELNTQLEKALEAVTDQQLHFEVLSPIRTIREVIGRATKLNEAVVRVNINIFGTRGISQQVGRELCSRKVYLQRPDVLRHGVLYDNPHVLKLANIQPSRNGSVFQVEEGKAPEGQKEETFKKMISDVYSSLTRDHRLIGLEGDERLKTPLLLHQKKALDFMSQRENGPISEEYRLWKPDLIDGQPCLRHVITGLVARTDKPETGGGILADEMGMGKTLSILALVLRSLDAAHKWAAKSGMSGYAHEIPTSRKPAERTRATLIIASSDLMINEWMQEMERHFDHHTNAVLKTIKYHGQNREKDVAKLRDADMVLTTYHTLASDFVGKANPLNEIEWYRLVLDEAHIIRRQSTGLYKTVAQLKARSRWCLTGTPIQNRLEDIGSLFAFIRLDPFYSLSVFRKFIAVPFDEGEKRRKMAIERFTRLLDSSCLRRTKDLLHLPDQHDRVRLITFSAEEKEQYEQTGKMMFRAVKNQVGVFDHKSTLGMFQVQLQLRILCNHGTYQQPFSWNRRKLHLIDEREAMEATIGQDGEVTCSNCRQTMPMYGAELYKRYTEHCKHVLCSECIEESMPNMINTQRSTTADFPADCPLCSSLWSSVTSTVSQAQHPTHSGVSDSYFRPQGRSSKMEALITDLSADLWSTKSIVFSCWTHTLDLIQSYLKNSGIYFQRIDGECPTAKREKILEDFAKNPHLRVLIMTTGTGAVGLNLATANRVFLVEPQWNPSVENQAIARALRLGQEQTVQVTRYVVDKTVEQEMRTLQDRKLEIAGIAWE